MTPSSPASRRLELGLLIVAALLLGLRAAPTRAGDEGADAEPAAAARQGTALAAISRAFVAAMDRASPATVALIHTAVPAGDGQAWRTGMAISKRRIITDAANLQGIKAPYRVIDGFGVTHRVHLVGRDLRVRVALLELSEGRLDGSDESQHAAFARALARADEPPPGALVTACGRGERPRGRPVGAYGIVSARSRFAHRALQISADLNRGNAGGPVVDLDGRRLGLSVLLPRETGIDSGVGFFLPWRVLEDSLERMGSMRLVTSGSLGVLVPGDDLPGLAGVPVSGVRSGSAAARAGVKTGDLITAIDGKPIRSVRDLSVAVAWLAADDIVQVELQRGEQVLRLEFRAEARD